MSRANCGKVAILTFHEALNYGAVLQAYALQESLRSLGYEPEILNYLCPAIKEAHFEPGRTCKAKISWILHAFSRRARIVGFDAFKQRHLALSEPANRADIQKVASCYDAIIVGSDQVWNPDITGGDTTYFLDFMADGAKKKSYAASLGLKSWDAEFEPLAAELLRDFSSISVREESAADYLQGLTGSRPNVACDPVMLLDKEDWLSLAKNPKADKPYLLIVSLGKVDEDCLEWARDVASERGVEIVAIHYGALPHVGVKNVRGASPEEYLGWIKNAELVVTHSFHACCFSILFERQFYWFQSVLGSESRGTRTGRLSNLLETFGLEERAVTAKDIPRGEIDYARVVDKLSAYRETSLSYLERII